MKKYTEASLKRNAKTVENNMIFGYDITLAGEVIGTIQKIYRGWEARTLDGHRIGIGSSKGEAKFFVAWHFVGDDGIEWGTN